MLLKIIDYIERIARFVWQIVEKVTFFILCRIFKIKLSNERRQAVMQFIKFGLVGASNTVISYVIYTIALLFFRLSGLMSQFPYIYLLGGAMGFIISVAWSFLLNNRYVFKVEEGEKRSLFLCLMKTYASYAFSGLILSNLLLILWIEFLHISEFLAPILNLFVTVPINFLANKFWAFKGKK